MIGPGSALRRVARRAVRLALSVPKLRAVVAAELRTSEPAARGPQPPAPTPPPEPPSLPATFVDRHGTAHALDAGLRDRLKPSWRVMCDPVAVAAPPTDEALQGRARKAVTSVAEMERLLSLAGAPPLGGRILEVGCYDGAVAFELSRRDGVEMVASDLARYYVVQRPGEPAAAAIAREAQALAELRDRARVVAGVPAGRVRFVEDDITSSTLEPGTFDAILSFEVLEHVQRPADAFDAMARLLRPGGVVYHDYNPFFAENGGHSLVTLDLPWGHARLDADDLERYLREVRPSEADQAGRFYRESLNRMTLADLRAAISQARLEPLAIVPWFDRSLIKRMPSTAVAEVQSNYSTATVEDLLATFVVVIARRPAAPG